MKNKEVTDFQAHTPELRQLYSRHSSKWRRFSADVLPMHVAEMDFEIAEPIRSQLARMVTESDLGYLGPVPEVAAAFEKFAASRWGWKIDPTQLKLATDVGVATVEYLRANLQPGERVVITSPVYSGFFEWLKELDIEPFDVPLAHTEHGWRLDLGGLEQAFAQGHLTLLLCNPHNPVGRAFDRQELTALAELAARYGATVISDEIHAPLTYGEFVPYLSCGNAAEQTGVVITSSSKSWNLAGLKAAFLLTQSAPMAAKVAKLPPATHWRTSIPGAFSMATAYSEGVEWLDTTLEVLDDTAEAAQKSAALITNKKRPRLTKVTGKVKTTKTGRTTRLKRPITKAAIRAAPKPCTSTPLSMLAKAMRAVAQSNHFKISFMCSENSTAPRHRYDAPPYGLHSHHRP